MTKTPLRAARALAVLLVLFAAYAVARDDTDAQNRYTVSAKAGGVNYVAGLAELRRADKPAWHTLSAKDELRAGDFARTGRDGRIELLLTPGSYLRLGANSEIEFSDTSLDRLTINLRQGTLVVEALGADDGAPLVTVNTPHTKIEIVRGGIYRVGARAGDTEVRVQKGRALVGKTSAVVLVKGNRKFVTGTTAATDMFNQPVKFNKSERDELDLWSKERAEELAKVNRRLSARALSRTLMTSSIFNDPFAWGSRSTGIWVFDNRRACYTFVPAGWRWNSPYGNSYGTTFGYTGGNGAYNGGGIVVGSGGMPSGSNSGGNNNGGVTVNPPRVDMPESRPMPTSRPDQGGMPVSRSRMKVDPID